MPEPTPVPTTLTPANSQPSVTPSSRRSTGTSGSGLEYYWSTAAGIGPSSSSSSLAGAALGSPNAHAMERLHSSSSTGTDPRHRGSDASPLPSPWSSDSSTYSFSNSPVITSGEMDFEAHPQPVQVWAVHRESTASGTTARPGGSARSSNAGQLDATPMPPTHASFNDIGATSPVSTYDAHATPTMPQSATPTMSGPSPSRYVPGSGRLVREMEEPQSAPAWKSEFGPDVTEGEETIKGRKRSTLPAEEPARLGTPDARGRGSSPVPPPRSTLRSQFAALSSPVPNLDLYSPPRAGTLTTEPDVEPGSSASITDLTAMLGGAIDEIGLIDSRETPPPMIGADPRAKPDTPDTPLPSRGDSLVAEVFTPRPWPAAMLFGHIKSIKQPGDRANAYARGINELARADSGLSEWCALSISTPNRPKPAPTALSNFNPFSPTIHIAPVHPRTVSSSSEFPMRDDHQTAREISQRVIDPAEPTGLPATLPYPQVQQIRGIRPSPSTTSMATKRGFFSALRSRKDSGLGPPTGQAPKSLRNLAISAPERQAAPLGPRPPRSMAEDEPRSSIDSGRLTPRASVDSARAKVREEDVRAVADVLPHVDRGVLRVYLAKHGDQMAAISAYLEDEKRT